MRTHETSSAATVAVFITAATIYAVIRSPAIARSTRMLYEPPRIFLAFSISGGIDSGQKKNLPLTQSFGFTALNMYASSLKLRTVIIFLNVSICQRVSFAGWKYKIHPPEGKGESREAREGSVRLVAIGTSLYMCV
jgi:hypothetical protein